MPVICRLAIDRPQQLETLDDRSRAEIESFHVFLCLGGISGPEGIDLDRKRFSLANGIRDLDFSPARHSSGNQLVARRVARRAEIQISYAIGEAKPLSVKVDTFGTGNAAQAEEYVKTLDFRPAAIIERFKLLRPIYRQTTNYGHFGKPGLPWEA